MSSSAGPARVVLISSCDRLADIACAGLFKGSSRLALAGVVRTQLRASTRWRLVRTAVREGALFYVGYMFLEMTLPAFRTGRGEGGRVLEVAARADAPVHVTSSVNDEETIAFVDGLAPDVVLSVRPGTIFRQRLIDAVPPIVNLHCSLLPDFRGIGGVLQALAAGSATLGCSVHFVPDEQVDRGDIAAQLEMSVTPARSVYYHTLGLYGRGPEALRRAVTSVREGSAATASVGGSYFSWPDRSTLRQLRARGHRLVEWRDLRDPAPPASG